MYKNKIVKLQLWYVNMYSYGWRRYEQTESYMRDPQGFAVVFDVTDYDSFQEVREWLRFIIHYSNDDVPIIVIGTKSDCVKKRCVEREEVEAFIPEQIKYFETSAKYPHVSTSMSTITENLVADIISNYDEIRDAQAEALKSRDGGCCVVS